MIIQMLSFPQQMDEQAQLLNAMLPNMVWRNDSDVVQSPKKNKSRITIKRGVLKNDSVIHVLIDILFHNKFMFS